MTLTFSCSLEKPGGITEPWSVGQHDSSLGHSHGQCTWPTT